MVLQVPGAGSPVVLGCRRSSGLGGWLDAQPRLGERINDEPSASRPAGCRALSAGVLWEATAPAAYNCLSCRGVYVSCRAGGVGTRQVSAANMSSMLFVPAPKLLIFRYGGSGKTVHRTRYGYERQ